MMRRWLDAHEVPRSGMLPPAAAYVIVCLTYLIGFGLAVYAAFGYLLSQTTRTAMQNTTGFSGGTALSLFLATVAIAIAIPLLNVEAPTWWHPKGARNRWRSEVQAFGLGTVCITIGLAISSLLLDMPDYPRGTGSGAAVGDLLSSLMAGPAEEIIVLVVPMVFLRAARWPWWAVIAAAVLLRLAFHVYYGPAAIGLTLWAIGMIVVYLGTHAVLGLIAAHSWYDVSSTVASYGSEALGVAMAATPLFATLSYYFVTTVRTWFRHRREARAHTSAGFAPTK